MKKVFLTLFVLCILYAIGLLESDINNVLNSLIVGFVGLLFLFAGLNINHIKTNSDLERE